MMPLHGSVDVETPQVTVFHICKHLLAAELVEVIAFDMFGHEP